MQSSVVRIGLQHQCCQSLCLCVVGCFGIDEILVQQVDADHRTWLLLNIFGNGSRYLGWSELIQTDAQLGQFVILVGSGDGHLLQMSGVALDFHLFAWRCKHSLFAEIGEYQHECDILADLLLIGETSVLHFNGVNTHKGSVGTIHQKLALVDVTQASCQSELVP